MRVLVGPIELHMWAQTDATDADFIARISDVAPDGSSMLITTGYVRASHRAWDPSKSIPSEPWTPQ
ncbi:MAG TPA: CocE/NonD family hydrolase C-terminal non-catalytic domain-containing protein [Actinomycetota bacterium]